ncbi:hypothetical protein [Lewinella cohaerens]|uniref:hypothetical protein n=1 Tax=Lewinella cohaerens TaxID=70995 RepID=UPI0012EC1BFB|nr:hypothetical protein [Lewinella cohaerens]
MKDLLLLVKGLTALLLTMVLSCNSIKQELFYEANDEVNLYSFIGEKISLTEFNPDERYNEIKVDTLTGDTTSYGGRFMDRAFDAKYLVVEEVFNDLGVDTIDFVVFNHYGRPLFEENEYVLLHLSSFEGGFFLQKYQYDIVEKNQVGIWKVEEGKTIKELFLKKKNGVFKARDIFK